MFDTFFQEYSEKYMNRGYNIIGRPLTIKFLVVIFCLVLLWFHTFYFSDIVALVITLRLFLVMLDTGNLMDRKIEEYQQASVELKSFISLYLKKSLNFNHSIQYKEFANLLKQKSEMLKNSYNLLPYLTMTLAVLLFLSSLSFQIYPDQLRVIIVITVAVSLFVIALNPIANGLINLFRTDKKTILINLSNTVQELYIEKNVLENQAPTVKKKRAK